MKVFRVLSILTLIFALGVSVTSCKKVSDADIQNIAQTKLATIPEAAGVTVTVANQVLTLNGVVADEAAKSYVESSVTAVKGVKSIVNNLQIPPPAPDFTSLDNLIDSALVDVLKDHKTITATVENGVITLNGEIKKADLPIVMQKLNALNPERIDNNLTIK